MANSSTRIRTRMATNKKLLGQAMQLYYVAKQPHYATNSDKSGKENTSCTSVICILVLITVIMSFYYTPPLNRFKYGIIANIPKQRLSIIFFLLFHSFFSSSPNFHTTVAESLLKTLLNLKTFRVRANTV